MNVRSVNLFRLVTSRALVGLAFLACSSNRPSADPSIKAVCKDGTLSACPRDSRLLFQVNGLSGKFYLSAYLENTESHDQNWLAPSADDDPMTVQIHPGEQVLARSIPLSMLSKGAFTVHAWLTAEPVTRQHLLQGQVASRVAAKGTLIVTRAHDSQ